MALSIRSSIILFPFAALPGPVLTIILATGFNTLGSFVIILAASFFELEAVIYIGYNNSYLKAFHGKGGSAAPLRRSRDYYFLVKVG